MSDDIIEAGVAVASGVVFLSLFYSVMRVDWPEHYFATTDFSAFAISSSPLRYALFRFAPVFVTCSVVAVTLDRRGSSFTNVAPLFVAATHGGLTLGVALIEWMRSSSKQRSHRASIALIRFVALLGVLATAGVATVVRSRVAFVIPETRELGTTLWTAGFASIAGAFVLQYSRSHGMSDSGLIATALRSVPKELTAVAEQVCKEVGADIDLVLALMAVENLQRPPWFRSLERLKSRVLKAGTYGIMQVASPVAVSDEDSIRIAVRDRLAKVNVKNAKGDLDADALKGFATEYNGGPTYVSTLTTAYYTAKAQRTAAQQASAAPPGQAATVPGAATKDQCMFCAKRLAADEPCISVGPTTTNWVSRVDSVAEYDVAVAHPHCYAVFRGVSDLARLKRAADRANAGAPAIG